MKYVMVVGSPGGIYLCHTWCLVCTPKPYSKETCKTHTTHKSCRERWLCFKLIRTARYMTDSRIAQSRFEHMDTTPQTSWLIQPGIFSKIKQTTWLLNINTLKSESPNYPEVNSCYRTRARFESTFTPATSAGRKSCALGEDSGKELDAGHSLKTSCQQPLLGVPKRYHIQWQ